MSVPYPLAHSLVSVEGGGLFMAPWLEVTSYVASALVFLSFFMKEIVPLRLFAIVSNVAFMIYAIGAGLLPILILDAALLPLNVWRLLQYRQLQQKVREASRGAPDLDKVVPLMERTRREKGDVLFRSGDPADALFYVEDGTLRLEELGVELGPGAILGEIALFLDGEGRTATATCASDCTLRSLSRKRVEELVMVDPGFGLFLTKLVASRLQENVRLAQTH
tara:strand:- start:8983 stop:9648 length:666 start_codon:yes stop_codon:yes gene_type:complete